MAADEKFLYRDLSYKIIGCFYEIYNELGPAHKDRVYHEALKAAFREEQIIYVDNKRLKIKFMLRNFNLIPQKHGIEKNTE